MKYLSILIIGLGVISAGCRKDKIDDEIIIVTPTGDETDTNIKIIITDNNRNFIANAVVEIDGNEITSDENGLAWSSDILFDSEGQLTKVIKQGYYTSYKRIIPNKNKETVMHVSLIPKIGPAGTFNADTGGQVFGNSGELVTFKPGSIITKSSNSDYTDIVNVYLHHFDPSRQETFSQMPGNLNGIDSDGNAVQLTTYGMLLVELEGSGGQKLNIKEGFNAEISLPIPTQLIGQAPSEIPLWSLDETTGLWIQESRAFLTNNAYRGEVPHFSFWNCDAPFPLVNITGILSGAQNQPLPYTQIIITTEEGGVAGYGSSNGEGLFSGKVPKGVILQLAAYDHCHSLYDGKSIGPLNSDTDLGEVIVDIGETTHITGLLLTCDGDPVNNGYINIRMNDSTNTMIDVLDGIIDASISLCNTTILTIRGFDLDGNTLSNYHGYQVTDSEYDLGSIFTCNEPDEFITITSHVGTISALEVAANIEGEKLRLSGVSGQDFMSVTIEGTTTGSFELDQIFISPEILDPFGCGGIFGNECTNIVNAEITQLVGIEDHIRGTISGQIFDQNNLVDVFIQFKVKLDDIKENVSGKVWADVNGDGIQNDGEDGLKDIKMTIVSNGTTFTYRTKSDGLYSHYISTQTPFNIRVSEDNVAFTLQDAGSDDTIDSDFDKNTGTLNNQQLVWGSPIANLDCGLVSIIDECNFETIPSNCVEKGGTIKCEVPGAIQGSTFKYVFSADYPDFPHSVSTTTEVFYFGDVPSGINVTVDAFVNNIPVCSEVLVIPQWTPMVTDIHTEPLSCDPPVGIISIDTKDLELGNLDFKWSNGETTDELILVSSGNYQVTVTGPLGCEEVLTIDANFEESKSISGMAWKDSGGTMDVFDSVDKSVFDIEIKLLDENFIQVTSATTDDNGQYFFRDLNEGDYILEIVLEGGEELVNKDVGSDDSIDSDADPMTLRTDVITIGAGCYLNNTTHFGIK